jgi:hypothetical protein
MGNEDLAGAEGGDDRRRSGLADELAQGVFVIDFVGDDPRQRCGQRATRRRPSSVMGLAIGSMLLRMLGTEAPCSTTGVVPSDRYAPTLTTASQHTPQTARQWRIIGARYSRC